MPIDHHRPNTMKLNSLGISGPLVSNFALGTMTFGAETSEAEAFQQLDLFVDQGGTFIDTADVYSEGAAEQIIGKWNKQRGGVDDLVLATKGRFGSSSYQGASPQSLTKSVNASLERLHLETIDVYFIHGWDKNANVVDTLGTLSELMSAGKLRNIAWSNVSGWQLQKIVSVAQSENFPMPVALQPQYNLLERGIELEVLPCCLENNISVTPWSPLGGGWLTGKYTATSHPRGATRLGENPSRGVEAYALRNNERTHAVIKTVQLIADKYKCPASHVALAWVSSRPGVASVLLGARTIGQLADNMAAANFTLELSDLEELTRVSSLSALHYPYNFLRDWCEMDVWSRLGT